MEDIYSYSLLSTHWTELIIQFIGDNFMNTVGEISENSKGEGRNHEILVEALTFEITNLMNLNWLFHVKV